MIGLAFDEVDEEIGILGGEGAELVEERLLGLQLLAERKAGVTGHEASRRRGPGATNMELAGARFLAGCWKFKVGSRQF